MNICGRVNLMVFDKTGTLTEEGLEIYGYRSVKDFKFQQDSYSEFGAFRLECSDISPKNNR